MSLKDAFIKSILNYYEWWIVMHFVKSDSLLALLYTVNWLLIMNPVFNSQDRDDLQVQVIR